MINIDEGSMTPIGQCVTCSSIVVLDIVSGVWLVLIGVMQIVQAFQIRKDVKAARQTLDAVSEPVAA
jgi:uncharacterized membrane protein HdeD (DUF308 family)